jgi:hypothetical protein
MKDVHIRLPIELIEWLDQYARKLSYEHNTQVTRTSLITAFVKGEREHHRYCEIRKLNKEMINDLASMNLKKESSTLLTPEMVKKYRRSFDHVKY